MIAAATLLAATLAVTPASGACALCHPDVRVEHERSAHGAENVSCVACHGGDAAGVSVEAGHRGMRGVPRRRDIPALCAACHSDISRMRPYNLPADQYALYQTSQHGRQLAKGDDRVAVCTDCHGVHDIRRPEDPASRVFPRNIPSTCAACHADQERMRRYGIDAHAYEAYAVSVHGRALLEQGNGSAPDCARCHGAHGATPPGVGDVDKVCGQCHESARSAFLQGPHKSGMDAAGLPECASCHQHHDIQPATGELLDTVCLNCHAAGSGPLEVATSMQSLYGTASDEIDLAVALVDRASSIPLYVEDYRARLAEARTALVESLPMTHSLDVSRVRRLTDRARSIAGEVEMEVNAKLAERWWRRVGLLVFWFYLLLTVAILVRFRHRAAAEAHR